MEIKVIGMGCDKCDALYANTLAALEKGLPNLEKHIENMKKFGVPVVVAINRFATDTDAEIAVLAGKMEALGVPFSLCEHFAKGGEGAVGLAEKVVAACEEPSHFHPLYELDQPIEAKIETIAREIYGADGVEYAAAAKKAIKDITALGKGDLPICMAKTQYSLSDNQKLLGRPTGFVIHVGEVRLSAGAGFIVVQTGDIMTMPGLPKVPAANNIDIDESGRITGLF